uniref:N-acetyltransferase domain-containing protein n=1 Tax=Fusarium oxysporum (strain Fo5176) TaxID=660025 RepID=A0A0D2Y1Z8_FUSOF
MANKFSFHDASTSFNDAQFMADAMDSTIPHLVAAGNAGQWGTEPLSRKESFMQKMHDAVSKSEQFCETGAGDRERIFIAEVEDDQTSSGSTANGNLSRRVDENGKSFVSVGFVKLVEEQFALIEPALKKGKFVFLQYLVTDHRVGDRRRGAGAALLQKVKDYTLERGWKTIWLDCWDGGNGQLVQYYVDQGFHIMGSFGNDHDDGSSWNGKLFRMDMA